VGPDDQLPGPGQRPSGQFQPAIVCNLKPVMTGARVTRFEVLGAANYALELAKRCHQTACNEPPKPALNRSGERLR